MKLSSLDWLIVAAFFLIYLGIGVVASRRARGGFSEFFLSGQRMPWWLLGFSMVATTFATDTPNLVTNIVRTSGVAGNWVWWAFLLSGTVTVFFYAKLWRRSGVLTDIEFNELRYSGNSAAVLRGFRAVYLGIFFNVMIMANVTLAAVKIGAVVLGLTPMQTISIAATITVLYSMAGGLTGVLLTDLLQFGVAMAGAFGAAWFVLKMPEVGGMQTLMAHPKVTPLLDVLPDFSAANSTALMATFVIPLTVQWWSSYYPGAEPGGGGYVVQRLLAAKNERHAVGATLLFNAMHYAFRPWPWIVVALASVVVFPTLDSIQKAFPNVDPKIIGHDLAYPAMLTFLPAGLAGLVMASLIAAYMSTMSTQVNWGASVLVNDLYRRYLRPTAPDKELVRVGQVATVACMVLACVVALWLDNALQAFGILLQIGAGTGLLMLLRWFWWRINAACEIAAMVISFVVAVVFQFGPGKDLGQATQLVIGVAITTVGWIIVALLTKPVDEERLREFYRRVQPGGPGWKAVVERAKRDGVQIEGGAGSDGDLGRAGVCAVASTIGIYALIFAGGWFTYGRTGQALAASAVALISGAVVLKQWNRLTFR